MVLHFPGAGCRIGEVQFARADEGRLYLDHRGEETVAGAIVLLFQQIEFGELPAGFHLQRGECGFAGHVARSINDCQPVLGGGLHVEVVQILHGGDAAVVVGHDMRAIVEGHVEGYIADVGIAHRVIVRSDGARGACTGFDGALGAVVDEAEGVTACGLCEVNGARAPFEGREVEPDNAVAVLHLRGRSCVGRSEGDVARAALFGHAQDGGHAAAVSSAACNRRGETARGVEGLAVRAVVVGAEAAALPLGRHHEDEVAARAVLADFEAAAGRRHSLPIDAEGNVGGRGEVVSAAHSIERQINADGFAFAVAIDLNGQSLRARNLRQAGDIPDVAAEFALVEEFNGLNGGKGHAVDFGRRDGLHCSIGAVNLHHLVGLRLSRGRAKKGNGQGRYLFERNHFSLEFYSIRN